MSVNSPQVTVTVQQAISYALSIDVSPQSGYVGDTFTFTGRLTGNGYGIAGKQVQLILYGGGGGITTTDADGYYSIPWVANLAGNIAFLTRATI